MQDISIGKRVFWHYDFACVHEAAVFVVMLPNCSVHLIEEIDSCSEPSFSGVLPG
jgi:hypothetical protein